MGRIGGPTNARGRRGIGGCLRRCFRGSAIVTSLRDMSSPRIAIGPTQADFALDAVLVGGGTVVGIDEAPDALVWLDPRDVEGLRDDLVVAPHVR